MTGAALALQKAILAWLQAAPLLMEKLQGQGIYDHVPPHAVFPYISLGQSQVYAWDTDTGTGEEHSLVLHVWARSNGRRQVLELMMLVEELVRFSMSKFGLSSTSEKKFRLEYRSMQWLYQMIPS